jgi:FdhD protein
VAYPAARGSAASYYPETNVLVPLDSVAEVSNPPASKGIVVRLEPAGSGGRAGVTARRRVLRIREGAVDSRSDTLAAEEPMEIRVNGRALTITMRTPGDDFDLAVGFLAGEGVLRSAEDVNAVRCYCAGVTDDGSNPYNVVDVSPGPRVPLPETSLERSFYTTSSCGLCGKASLDAVRSTATWSVAEDPLRITPTTLAGLPNRLRAAQRVFDRTGGLHAAGLFTADGALLHLREDVGRHNAVDRVIGHACSEGCCRCAVTS